MPYSKNVLLAAIFLLSLVIVPAVPAQVPASNHVYIVLEENQNYSSIIGNTQMRYLNSLASTYGLATQYYANTHPSIGNYFMLTTGQIISNDDAFSGTVSADNIVRQLLTIGKTWKCYAESLPSVGYTGGDVYPYIKHHNPFAYISDVINSSVQVNNLVPFSQFASDLAGKQLPQYSFIVPNNLDNGHDGTLAQLDSWLQTNIQPLIASSGFQQSDLLVIVWDESDSDTAHGGGRVAMLVIGPKVKSGYQSTNFYQHQSTLRMMEQTLGLSSFLGAAATAPDMAEFFVAPGDQPPIAALSVTPTSGVAPLTVTASTSGSSDPDGTITSSTIDFGDGTAAINGTTIPHTYNSAGTYTVTATVTDNANLASTASSTVTVSAAPADQPPVAVLSVSPSSGAVPLAVTASTSGSSDPDGKVASSIIDFGDGSPPVSGPTATHTYTAPWRYKVKATVYDDANLSASTGVIVQVKRK